MFKKDSKENVYIIGNHTIDDEGKIRKKTSNYIKNAKGYLYVDTNGIITCCAEMEDTLFLFSMLCQSLLKIFEKTELKKLIDIVEEINLAGNDQEKIDKGFEKIAKEVYKIYEKKVEKAKNGVEILKGDI